MESRAKLDNILEDALRVIKTPAKFYREMPKTGGFSDPIIFVLVMAVLIGVMVAVWSLFGVGAAGAMAVGFGAIITVPLFALLGSFISAAVLFVIWKLMGSAEKYETAYRCAAYAAAIYPILMVLRLIPYLGTIAGVVWGIYLMITASVEVHRLDRKRTQVVFGILGLLLLVMNISSEMAARKLTGQMEQYSEQFEGIDEMTPQEAGRAVGGFLEGLNESARKAGNPDDSGHAADTLSTQGKEESAQAVSAEDAGKALGEFFSGLEQATRDMRAQAEQQADDVPAAATSSDAAVDAVQEE